MNQAIEADGVWRWCEREYARPGRVAELLRAQDERGADVMLELFLQYAHEHFGVTADAALRAEAEAVVGEWRADVIAPLRALRRALKGKPAPGAGGVEARQAVRRLLQEAELCAERAELDALCEWFARRG